MNQKTLKLLVFLVLGLLVVSPFADAIVFALVVAYVAMPLYRKINEKIKTGKASAWVTMIIVFSFILYPFVRISLYIASRAKDIGSMFSEFINSVLVPILPADIISESTTSLVSSKLTGVLSGVISSTPKMFVQLFIFIVMVYYILQNNQQLMGYIEGLVKKAKEESLYRDIKALLRAIFIGYFETALLVGGISYIAFRLMGYSYALILSALVFICTLLPLVGTAIIYIPLMAIEVLNGNYVLAVFVALLGIFLGWAAAYLAPKITATRYKIHPVIMIVGFLGGPLVFGIKGFILGPVILGALKVVLDHYVHD